jgi:hypothetical protein
MSDEASNHAEPKGGFCAAASLMASALASGASAYGETPQALRIDVPVTVQRGNVVFGIGHAVVNGDALFFVGDFSTLVQDYADWKTEGQIVAVFHGDAAYLVPDRAWVPKRSGVWKCSSLRLLRPVRI